MAAPHWGVGILAVLVLAAGIQPASAAPRKGTGALARGASGPAIKGLTVHPAQVILQRRRDERQLVVLAQTATGPRDVTHLAAIQPAGPQVAVSGGLITPRREGDTTLVVSYGGHTRRLPVSVRGLAAPDPVSFQFETLAVLTKQGCSGGSCHGSPHGKGGFSLSLFGYDPQIDRLSLTRDAFNRRLDLQRPAESLLLKKPLLNTPHVGGRRLRRTDAAYPILHNWVAEGARAEIQPVHCTTLEIAPGSQHVLNAAEGGRLQLSVLARFSNGTHRDVTRIAAFESSHPAAASVGPDGVVRAHGRGQAAISVRYLDQLESVQITVIQPTPGFRWPAEPEPGFIDRLVNQKLRQLQFPPSPVCSDTEFLRRVSLDLTGLLPDVARTRSFLEDRSPDRRARLVDELLQTEEHARFWALKRADLMRVAPARLPQGRAERFAEWLTRSFRENEPYDRFARSLLTASGPVDQAPAAAYFMAIGAPEERTEMTSQILMGTRVECAKCHNHPYEKWTMRDYYRIAAVFARVEARDGAVRLAASGEALHPTTREPMIPWGAEDAAAGGRDRRAVFADWLVQPNNPYFAPVEANRIWADLLGRGIVDPVDDFRSSNPPSNAPLLQALAEEFRRSGYDRRHLIRLICASRAYQRSSRSLPANERDETLFSHARPRLLTAEQLADAVGRVTHSLPDLAAAHKENAAVMPELIRLREALGRREAELTGARQDPNRDAGVRETRRQIAQLESRLRYATQRPYPQGGSFAVAFGQPPRETACTCERPSSPTLLQALELLNGAFTQQASQQAARHYATLDDAALVRELYLAAYSRLPNAAESEAARKFLAAAPMREQAVTDLVWTVLSTREFLFQH